MLMQIEQPAQCCVAMVEITEQTVSSLCHALWPCCTADVATAVMAWSDSQLCALSPNSTPHGTSTAYAAAALSADGWEIQGNHALWDRMPCENFKVSVGSGTAALYYASKHCSSIIHAHYLRY